jgi:hypothetical protein
MLHYEKANKYKQDPVFIRCKKKWIEIIKDRDKKFDSAMREYDRWFDKKVRPAWTSKEEQALAIAAATWVVRDWMASDTNFSFRQLASDPRFRDLLVLEKNLWNKVTAMTPETLLTNVIFCHAIEVLAHTGNKTYTVSSGLQWQLENTKLKGYPSEELRLPFPAIYIVTPPDKYRVYNELTGWHMVEGIYVVEDTAAVPRTWRLILVGLPNENSVNENDDAIFHWTVTLDPTLAVDKAIETSILHTEEQLSGKSSHHKVLKDGKIEMFKAVHPFTTKSRESYELMLPILKAAFSYVMNVVLYATLPGADIQTIFASKEYSSLRNRTNKLPKGKKKSKLLGKMRGIAPQPRILLGGNIVIDKFAKEANASDNETGRKQKVRYVVSGHWHHYWVGPTGDKKLTRKFVQPYWKGPEHAPLTQKKHVLKYQGE